MHFVICSYFVLYICPTRVKLSQLFVVVKKSNSNIYQALYWFSLAAVTDYRKLSGLKQHKFIIVQFWRSEVQ